jgi:hypothetical protein
MKGTYLSIYSRVVNAEAPIGEVLGSFFPWCADTHDHRRRFRSNDRISAFGPQRQIGLRTGFNGVAAADRGSKSTRIRTTHTFHPRDFTIRSDVCRLEMAKNAVNRVHSRPADSSYDTACNLVEAR